MVLLATFLTMAQGGCREREATETVASDAGARREEAPPELSVDGGGPFLFTWIDDEGEFHRATAIAEIPEERRSVVRVQDPTRPPTSPDRLWVADLSSAEGGRYDVRAMSRAEFLALAGRQHATTTPRPETEPLARAEGSETRVVMYMSSSCPVCRRARRWLTEQRVSFVERNVERDAAAARELQQRAREQGVPANGVPVFDVGGRLIAGFDQQVLAQALGL